MASSRWTYSLALLVLVAIFGFVAWYLAGRHDAVRGAQQGARAPNGPTGSVVAPPSPLQLWADAERQRAVAILLQAALERGTTKPEWALAVRANPPALESAKKFLRWHIKEGPLAQRSLARALLLDADEEGELPKVLADCALSGRDANQAARNVLTAHAAVFPGRSHTPEYLEALSKAKPVDVSFWLDVLKPAADPRAAPAVMERFAGEEFVKQGTTYAQMETVLLWLQAIHPEAPGMLVKRLAATGNALLIQKAVGQGLVLAVSLPLEALLKAEIPETAQAQAAMIAALKPHEGSPEAAERIKAIRAKAKPGQSLDAMVKEEEKKRTPPDPKDPQWGLEKCADVILFASPNARNPTAREMAFERLRRLPRLQVEAALRAREAHTDERIRESAKLAAAFFKDEFDALEAEAKDDAEQLKEAGARAAVSFGRFQEWRQARAQDWPQGGSPADWVPLLATGKDPVPALLHLLCRWAPGDVLAGLPAEKDKKDAAERETTGFLRAYLQAAADAEKIVAANGEVPAGDAIGTALEKARSDLGAILFNGSGKERKLVDLPAPFQEGKPSGESAADIKTEQSF
ncbi:MAG: hypothetical protein L6R28_25500 [Planctomycetes bacterium]|nr:hypothetical protein [Planctomycetota bacterium]